MDKLHQLFKDGPTQAKIKIDAFGDEVEKWLITHQRISSAVAIAPPSEGAVAVDENTSPTKFNSIALPEAHEQHPSVVEASSKPIQKATTEPVRKSSRRTRAAAAATSRKQSPEKKNKRQKVNPPESKATTENHEDHNSQFDMIDNINPDKMKVVELRHSLRELGLKTAGLKAVLVKRLKEAIEEINSTRMETKSVISELESIEEEKEEEIEIGIEEVAANDGNKKEDSMDIDELEIVTQESSMIPVIAKEEKQDRTTSEEKQENTEESREETLPSIQMSTQDLEEVAPQSVVANTEKHVSSSTGEVCQETSPVSPSPTQSKLIVEEVQEHQETEEKQKDVLGLNEDEEDISPSPLTKRNNDIKQLAEKEEVKLVAENQIDTHQGIPMPSSPATVDSVVIPPPSPKAIAPCYPAALSTAVGISIDTLIPKTIKEKSSSATDDKKKRLIDKDLERKEVIRQEVMRLREAARESARKNYERQSMKSSSISSTSTRSSNEENKTTPDMPSSASTVASSLPKTKKKELLKSGSVSAVLMESATPNPEPKHRSVSPEKLNEDEKVQQQLPSSNKTSTTEVQKCKPSQADVSKKNASDAPLSSAKSVTKTTNVPLRSGKSLREMLIQSGKTVPAPSAVTPKVRIDDMVKKNSTVSTGKGTRTITSKPKVADENPVATEKSNIRSKPSNLVTGLHSFASLVDKKKTDALKNTTTGLSHNSTKSSVSKVQLHSLKLAEKKRLAEEKKAEAKRLRKEQIAKEMMDRKKGAQQEKKVAQQQPASHSKHHPSVMKKQPTVLSSLKGDKESRAKPHAAATGNRSDGLQKGIKSSSSTKNQHSSHHEQERSSQSDERLKQLRQQDNNTPSNNQLDHAPEKQRTMSSHPTTTLVDSKLPQPAASVSSVSTLQKPSTSSLVEKTGQNYEMSDPESCSEEEASDEESERRSKKAIPEWAQKENLRRELFHQFVSRGTSFDPTPSIFPEFASTCDLEAIFPAADPEKKRRFEKRRRGSAIPNSRHS